AIDQRFGQVWGHRSAQCLMQWLQTQVSQSVFEAGNAATVKNTTKLTPGVGGIFMEVTPVEKDVSVIRMQLQIQSALREIAGAVQVFKPGNGVTIGGEERAVVHQTKGFAQSPLLHPLAASMLLRIRAGQAYLAARARVAIVEDH